MGRRRDTEVQPLPEGLPATISSHWWLGKGMSLSPVVDSLVSCLCHPPPPHAHEKGPWLTSVGLTYTKAGKRERELMGKWFQLEKAEGAWEKVTGVFNDFVSFTQVWNYQIVILLFLLYFEVIITFPPSLSSLKTPCIPHTFLFSFKRKKQIIMASCIWCNKKMERSVDLKFISNVCKVVLLTIPDANHPCGQQTLTKPRILGCPQ